MQKQREKHIQNLEGSAISNCLGDTTRQTVVSHVTDRKHKNIVREFMMGNELIIKMGKKRFIWLTNTIDLSADTNLEKCYQPSCFHATHCSSDSDYNNDHKALRDIERKFKKTNTYRYWRTSFQYISLGISPLSLFCAKSLEFATANQNFKVWSSI